MLLSFRDPASFDALWSSPTRIFFWTDQENPKELKGTAAIHARARRGKVHPDEPPSQQLIPIATVIIRLEFMGSAISSTGWLWRSLLLLAAIGTLSSTVFLGMVFAAVMRYLRLAELP